MTYYKENETKLPSFGKIAVYQIWTNPDLNKGYPGQKKFRIEVSLNTAVYYEYM